MPCTSLRMEMWSKTRERLSVEFDLQSHDKPVAPKMQFPDEISTTFACVDRLKTNVGYQSQYCPSMVVNVKKLMHWPWKQSGSQSQELIRLKE